MRLRRRGTTGPGAAVVRQAAAVCLGYPGKRLRTELPLLRRSAAHAPGRPGRRLRAFLEYAASAPRRELAEHYVSVFDLRNRSSLHLTWWTDGDTRRRGMSLVRFKEAYRAHGLEYAEDGELPDYLPAVLEFTARTRDASLLTEHRAALELLRLSLTEQRTPYAALLDAVCATLPGRRPKDRAAARALAQRPSEPEAVGLDGYGGGERRRLPLLAPASGPGAGQHGDDPQPTTPPGGRS
ncbi:nitrate reductase molybdenum cofactor assembly chaperone [Streptomyces sulphureus]|uniref:nitrate reductase molybdenum cofactor assembly chaperone n=1 Tax=Streptomyces sulphureus TaxID=47758 RepID=UPI00036C1A06|nr:nitrate reductase molybdenum cofactor assembly chaperone [Streptomyces sulphureus]